MGEQKTNPEKNRQKSTVKRIWLAMIGIGAIILVALFILPLDQNQEETVDSEQTPSSESPDTAPDDVLGQWQRTDGNYMIEISEVKENGTLNAVYYNPEPINVSEATMDREEGQISVSITLQDEGYPGSIYNLAYNPGQDALVGTYYLAGPGQTYRVQFVRAEQ
ncbi:MAG: hypothetical protein WD509_02020 [Candidatus Paceibacterota bacterium]